MNHRLSTQIRRSLVAVFLLGSVAAAPLVGSVYHSVAAYSHDTAPTGAGSAPPAGTDLWHLDTATRHATQAANNLTSLQIYNSPAGISDQSGWRFRDLRLVASTTPGTLSPMAVLFGLNVSITTGAAALVTMMSEDKVSLGIGLVSIDGQTPAAVTGQVSDNAITFTTPVSTAATDISVRATVSGVDLRVILHNANETAPVLFGLTPDPQAQVAQDADGAIRVTRAITGYADNGTSYVTSQTEYFVDAPVALDSNADSTAQVTAGPASVTLSRGASVQQQVAVAVDPAWLHDPTRVFPVQVDVPIVTSESAANTPFFGTVNSCAPVAPAPLARVVVGVEGTCTYNGQIYFDVSSIMFDTPIVSATLKMFTPGFTQPTGVQLYPNVRTSDSAMWQQPSWSSAAAIAPGSSGIAESASAAGWHSWDVTALVRRWVSDSHTNGGFVLAGTGAPVLFASVLGAGHDGPADAPYLDITYAPPPAANPNWNDGSPYIYGASGTFANCGNNTIIQCNGGYFNTAVVNSPMGGTYVRFPQTLSCNATPGLSYWKSTYDLMLNIYSLNMIPIVNFLPNSCPGGFQSDLTWLEETQDFAANMRSYITAQEPYVYFEIGNEPNQNSSEYPDTYPNTYADAAAGLYYNVGNNFPNWSILTGGMAQPTASTDPNLCNTFPKQNYDNYTIAQSALSAAEAFFIPASRLGLGVHPYKYNTQDAGYWQNYYYRNAHTYAGPCFNLSAMINLWVSVGSNQMPVVFTEDSWTDIVTRNDSNAIGTYLVDLFTWLYDHGDATASSSLIRVAWFRGIDISSPVDYLGIYDLNSNPKWVDIPFCNIPIVKGLFEIVLDYNALLFNRCY